MTQAVPTISRTLEIVINIGHMPIRVLTQDAAFHELLSSRYAGFLDSDTAPLATLDVEIVAEPKINDGDVEVRIRHGRWFINGRIFPPSSTPPLRQAVFASPLNPYSIDTVLRILHGLLLVRHGGFLLHAASAIRNGKAFLFSGLSGAGKTTIAGLSPPDATLLTDEISYVRRESGRYIACGTPFAGELARLGANKSAPIETLFLLAKI